MKYPDYDGIPVFPLNLYFTQAVTAGQNRFALH